MNHLGSLARRVCAVPAEARSELSLRGVTARVDDRTLASSLDLDLGRQRVAVVGDNGAGKTTLLEIMLGLREPASGVVARDLARIGAITQGGASWLCEESLLALLDVAAPAMTTTDAARLLAARRFPLALAERALRSLSPGERTWAALLVIFARSPAVELLLLDEPTYSLDLFGQRAMNEALAAWPGGLVVASRDRNFLTAIGIERGIAVGDRREAPTRIPT